MKVSEVMQPQVVTVLENETLGRALQLMLHKDIRHLPVLRAHDSRLVGVLSERDVLRAHQERPGEEVLLHCTVSDFMSTPAEHIHPNADLADAAADMSTRKLGCLPVVDAGELVGIVAVEDVLAVIAQLPIPRPGGEHESVKSVMSLDPLVAHEDDRVAAAAAQMLRAGVRHMCVVDGEHRVLGILSDRDVRRAIGDPRTATDDEDLPERLAELRVGSAMTPNPRTLQQDAPLSAALDALLTERFGALPVVDADDRVCGIVSYIDVLRRLADRVNRAA